MVATEMIYECTRAILGDKMQKTEEFVLQMNDPDTGELLFLVCPYSKIWNCLYDIIKQLVDKIE